MGRRKHAKSKVDDQFRGSGNTVFHMDGVDVTLKRMPYVDGWVCRGGVHGDTKYNRRKEKRDLARRLEEG